MYIFKSQEIIQTFNFFRPNLFERDHSANSQNYVGGGRNISTPWKIKWRGEITD